jgi:DNA invertase Pin-like site-specific DNA recombinase
MNAKCTSAVGYFRVSTKRQGESGLGLDAQQKAVGDYCRSASLSLSKTFKEMESGKRSNRPQLAMALAHCRRTGAKLIVAKMDRLARNLHFLTGLLESKVDFIACDNPHANRLTVHILAAVAENEATAISQRTTAALAAAKRRGQLLGSARPGHWNGREDRRIAGAMAGNKASAQARHESALTKVADLLPTIHGGRKAGKTFQSISDELNSDGHTTSTGREWTAVGVIQVMRRFPA